MNKRDENFIFDILNYVNMENKNDEDFKIDRISYIRIKNNINKKLLFKNSKRRYIAVAILSIISLGVFSIASPTMASNIQNSIIEAIEHLRGDYAEYEKYTNKINLSTYDKNIYFSIDEIACDGNKMFIAYSITSKKDLSKLVGTPYISLMEFKVNGKKLKDIGVFSIDGRFVNRQKYIGITDIDLMRQNIPDKFHLDIHVKSINKLQGNWNFATQIDKSQIQSRSKKYNINKTIDVGDSEIYIQNINISPISLGVELTGSIEKYNYFIFDDAGNELQPMSGSESGTEAELYFNAPENMNTKYLTFIPFEYNGNFKPDYKIYDIDKLPLEISEGDLGKIIINRFEWNKDVLKVSYTTKGKIPSIQSEGLYLFDEHGKVIEAVNRFGTMRSSKSSSSGYEFEKYFTNVHKNEKYKIGTDGIENFYKISNKNKFIINLN